MINKDDIDVSKCVFLAGGKFCNAEYEENCNMMVDCSYCKSLPDCYYKQLQWKIHECEAHQNCIKTLQDYINTEWKRNCKKEDELIETINSNVDKLRNYKKTLNEIKELCETASYTCSDGIKIRPTICYKILSIIEESK